MGKEDNLLHGNPDTQFKKGEQRAVEAGKKGAEAFKRNQKRRKTVKKSMQAILDGTYTTKDGEELEGIDMMTMTLFKVATDKDHKQCIQAQRLIYELTEMDKTADDKKRIKQALKLQEKELELMQKKIDKEDDWF